jgi:hypothetical protein
MPLQELFGNCVSGGGFRRSPLDDQPREADRTWLRDSLVMNYGRDDGDDDDDGNPPHYGQHLTQC